MITVARSAKDSDTDVTKMKTYIYRLNFQCLANSIDEADVCFAENVQLFYQKNKPGHLSPCVSVEILSPPKYPEITEVPR